MLFGCLSLDVCTWMNNESNMSHLISTFMFWNNYGYFNFFINHLQLITVIFVVQYHSQHNQSIKKFNPKFTHPIVKCFGGNLPLTRGFNIGKGVSHRCNKGEKALLQGYERLRSLVDCCYNIISCIIFWLSWDWFVA